MLSFLAEELVEATDAIGLVIAALVGEAGKMLLAILTAEVLSVERLVTHHDTLAGSDGHVACSAEKTLLLIEVSLAVWIAIITRDKAESLERLIAHGALEALLMPNLAHSLDLRLIFNGSVASAANGSEDLIVISYS